MDDRWIDEKSQADEALIPEPPSKPTYSLVGNLLVLIAFLLATTYFAYALAISMTTNRSFGSHFDFDFPRFQKPLLPVSPRELAANSTLGFEKILALSKGTPWRLHGLHAAADYTGITIDFPTQPRNDEEMIQAFEDFGEGDVKHPPAGAATAWLAHLDLLKFVLQSGYSTALILEDDVDWDFHILEQMRLLSDSMREYDQVVEDDPAPYGSGWDVLWLGHCGEWYSNKDPFTWPDSTVIPHELYRGWAKSKVATIPEHHRVLNPTEGTVCSFAYAVSLKAIPKLLNALSHGANEGYDIALSAACRDRDELRCLTVSPELFHHYVPPKEYGISSDVAVGDGAGELANEKDLEEAMGSTSNILNSVRCSALFQSQCVGNTWTR